jgi:hypothetical protein
VIALVSSVEHLCEAAVPKDQVRDEREDGEDGGGRSTEADSGNVKKNVIAKRLKSVGLYRD